MTTPRLKIWCGLPLDAARRNLLLESVAPHEVIFSEDAPGLLNSPAADPALREVDIAFGQPEVTMSITSERLRWIQLSTAGYTRYDTPDFRSAMAARGVSVTNSSGVFAEPCAQHTLAFMLAQARLLPEALTDRSACDSENWCRLRTRNRLLKNDTVLLLGYGAIARRLVELLAPFGVKIIAMRRHPTGEEIIPVITVEKLESALTRADHVVNILPAGGGTDKFMNRTRFAAMKHGAVFYNIGRGKTVDQDALADSLMNGHLAAAWLDVTEPEPLPADHLLRVLPNCHITPHTAGGYSGEMEGLILHFADNFERFLSGRPLCDRIM